MSPLTIWDDERDDRVAEIEVGIVRITEADAKLVAGAWCVTVDDVMHVPISSFHEVDDLPHDDTHDLRTRWFATESEARDHARYVRELWDDPAPWQSFVQV